MKIYIDLKTVTCMKLKPDMLMMAGLEAQTLTTFINRWNKNASKNIVLW